MDYRELFKKARELYVEAADADDIEERKDLEAQADDVMNRAELAQKAAGIPTSDDLDDKTGTGVPTPEAKGIADLMANQNYTDNQIKNVLAALDKDNAPGAPVNVESKEATFGEYLVAVRHNDMDALKAMGSRKDMEEGDGVSGGYTVPTQQLSELLMVPDSEAVVRPRARKIPMRSRSLTIPMLDQGDTPAAYWKLDYYGGVLSYWTEESGAKTETEPEFKQLELVAHKLAGYTQASDELLADSAIGLESMLLDLFRRSIVTREDFAFLRGTGVGMPLGVLNSGALVTQDRATANNIEYRDLARMMDQLLPSCYGNAVWAVSMTALPELLQMEDGAGNNVFIPNESGGVTQAMPGSIFGMPIIVTEKLPNLGTTGDVLLADFTYYIVGDRQNTSIASSEHYAFINDLTTWRFVHRVDGQPWLDEPIYIDTTNTASPFVALHANTTS